MTTSHPDGRFGELREIAAARPSQERWQDLCALLELLPPGGLDDRATLDHLAHHLDRWPFGLRAAPQTWIQSLWREAAPDPRLRLAGLVRLDHQTLPQEPDEQEQALARLSEVREHLAHVQGVGLLRAEAFEPLAASWPFDGARHLLLQSIQGPEASFLALLGHAGEALEGVELRSSRIAPQGNRRRAHALLDRLRELPRLRHFGTLGTSFSGPGRHVHSDHHFWSAARVDRLEGLSMQASNCLEDDFQEIRQGLERAEQARLKAVHIDDLLLDDTEYRESDDPWRVEQVVGLFPGLQRQPLEELDVLCWDKYEIFYAGLLPWIGDKALRRLRYVADERHPHDAGPLLEALAPGSLEDLALAHFRFEPGFAALRALAARSPLRSLRLCGTTGEEYRGLQDLLADDALAHLETLTLARQRGYSLGRSGSPPSGLRSSLEGAQGLQRLEHLRLEHLDTNDVVLWALAHGPLASRLRSLALEDGLNATALAQLTPQAFPSLRRLSLGRWHGLSEEALAELRERLPGVVIDTSGG